MSTNATDAEKATDRTARLSPANCILVGTDAEGGEHRFDWNTDTVYVLQNGTVEHTEHLDHGQLPEWVAYVAEKRGWADLRYRDTDPFAEAIPDV